MKFEEYIKYAIKTESTAQLEAQSEHRYLHGIVGLQTEIGELTEEFLPYYLRRKDTIDIVNILEECGDIFWYIALLYNTYASAFRTFNYPAERFDVLLDPSYEPNDPDTYYLDQVNQNIHRYTISLGRLYDMYKRQIFYGSPGEIKPYELVLNTVSISVTVKRIINLFNGDISKVLAANVAKLQKRYESNGGVFNQKDAIERDSDAERVLLEEEQ